MIIIGLTGGIASGKSAVAGFLAARGARVVDVDRLAHETYAPGTPGFAAVAGAFGPGIVAPDGSIDRRALGAIVFNDATQLKKLTDIVWPLTRQRLIEIRAKEQAAGTAVLVFEAAVLLEAGWRDLVDEVWLVRTPRDIARARLMTRNNLTAAEAETRLAAQPPDEERARQSDVIIDNDADLQRLEGRVETAWSLLQERAR